MFPPNGTHFLANLIVAGREMYTGSLDADSLIWNIRAWSFILNTYPPGEISSRTWSERAAYNFCGTIPGKLLGPFCSCGAPANTIPNESGPKRKVFFVVKSGNFHHNNASEHSWPPGPALSPYVSLRLAHRSETAPHKSLERFEKLWAIDLLLLYVLRWLQTCDRPIGGWRHLNNKIVLRIVCIGPK